MSKAFFAKRRPGWSPNDMPAGLQLSQLGHDYICTGMERATCPGCGKSRSWYCAECVASLLDTPKVKLPITVKIVTHPQEKRTKCTGVQAVLLAPENARLVEFTDVEKEVAVASGTAAVLFPSDGAATAGQVDLSKVNTLYIVDSKWKMARAILRRPEYKQMIHVRLSGNVKSSFWRFHTKGVSSDSVCTIEALFFFLRELQDSGALGTEFNEPHCFDDLLWYYALQYQIVSKSFEDKKRRRTGAAEDGAECDEHLTSSQPG